ncbi:DUF5908 family protein [Streptomyces justiciae]|uniref:DUF5908 family protein n=1 Tax=Streptomyces justiciae TaxID=2780140 RepID=A0ABU3M0A1_9ACTN|nr:DUF5908 family protein [Streptomyces justiciae]MDT7844932.1 DUF5908 family protein [Streptomyces justiciae]
MAVVISEIVTEFVVAPRPEEAGGAPASAAAVPEEVVDLIVRRAAERVLEILRREWDR